MSHLHRWNRRPEHSPTPRHPQPATRWPASHTPSFGGRESIAEVKRGVSLEKAFTAPERGGLNLQKMPGIARFRQYNRSRRVLQLKNNLARNLRFIYRQLLFAWLKIDKLLPRNTLFDLKTSRSRIGNRRHKSLAKWRGGQGGQWSNLGQPPGGLVHAVHDGGIGFLVRRQ